MTARQAPLVGYENAAAQSIARARIAAGIARAASEFSRFVLSLADGLVAVFSQFAAAIAQLARMLEPVRDAREVEGRALLHRHRRRRC